MDAAAEEAAREHTAALRSDLTALQQVRERAASAGMLRRHGAQRAVAQAEERFITAHGAVPEDSEAATWMQATATAAAHRTVSATGLPARAEEAAARAVHAQAEAEKAERAEVSLAKLVHTAQLDLTDLEAQEVELRQEARVRREMPEDPAAKENRQRHARTRQRAKIAAPARPAHVGQSNSYDATPRSRSPR